jgi:hypothetical protein
MMTGQPILLTPKYHAWSATPEKISPAPGNAGTMVPIRPMRRKKTTAMITRVVIRTV